jgi:hypothetical protein
VVCLYQVSHWDNISTGLEENLEIKKPNMAHEHVADWQVYLEWYRQVVIKGQEIAEEDRMAGA